MATAKIQCKCKHDFQDKRYGVGVRIANATSRAKEGHVEVRCTVCSATQTINNSRLQK